MRIQIWVTAAALILLPAMASGEEMKTTEVPVGADLRLVLAHPAGWAGTIVGPAPTPTVHFGPQAGGPAGGGFSIQITVFPPMHGVPKTERELDSMVRNEGQKLLPTASQKELEVAPVKGPQATGLLYHLTDRKPESGPGDYREMRQGALLVGQIYVSVQILTHSEDKATVEEALKMLAALRTATPK